MSDPECTGKGFHEGHIPTDCPYSDVPEPVDMVNKPPHYTQYAGFEVIDVTEKLNFCLGNAVKYILRCDLKGDAIQDLEKASWYLRRELDRRKAAAEASTELLRKLQEATGAGRSGDPW